MFLGRVIGNITASRKVEKLNGIKFLLVQPQPLKEKESAALVVAADRLGAGIGEDVIVAFGRAGRLGMGDENLPIEAAVVAIVDGKEIRAEARITKGLIE